MTRQDFQVFAPAKVNLALGVVGKREDGYHLLDSLVVFAGVGDTLSFAPGNNVALTIDGPMAKALSRQPDNIITKAARLLADFASCRKGAAIRLTKRLPVASGIGGGSTDAAAALKGLCRLWGLDLAAEDLAGLGLKIGADVPVCLSARPARMRGIGEIVESVPPLPPAWLVLVNPGVALPTPPVFKARTGPFSQPGTLITEPCPDAAALAQRLARGGNDLTRAAIGLAPVIGAVLKELDALPECLLARMSGSGATCFGLFDSADAARKAAASLRASHCRWWVSPAPLLADGDEDGAA